MATRADSGRGVPELLGQPTGSSNTRQEAGRAGKHGVQVSTRGHANHMPATGERVENAEIPWLRHWGGFSGKAAGGRAVNRGDSCRQSRARTRAGWWGQNVVGPDPRQSLSPRDGERKCKTRLASRVPPEHAAAPGPRRTSSGRQGAPSLPSRRPTGRPGRGTQGARPVRKSSDLPVRSAGWKGWIWVWSLLVCKHW